MQAQSCLAGLRRNSAGSNANPSRYTALGRVAQLAEQRTLNPPVPGSIPGALTREGCGVLTRREERVHVE